MSSNPYIYGVHDPGAEHLLQGRGWVVFTEGIGADPNDRSGGDYRHWVSQGLGGIVRLNYGYGKGVGTIPAPDRYADFAQRCANFVAASQGIQYVVIGNEIALEWEWPTDQPIRLTDYVQCYRRCYDAIKQVRPDVLIAPAAVAPWNDLTPDAPDWVEQLRTMLNMLSSRVDWVCLHAYTRGYDAGAFTTGARMNPPYAHRYSGWEALHEFMQAIPATLRHLPVMITECNGNGPWPAVNTGWIQALYEQIARWNSQPGNQQIRAACLFRWLPDDRQWSLAHSPGAAEDFRQALQRGYQWRADDGSTSENPKSPDQPATALKAGDTVTVVVTSVNVRNAPGLQAEAAIRLSQGDRFVVEAVYSADGLIWLQGPQGWVAEVAPDGTRLVQEWSSEDVPQPSRAEILRSLAAEYNIDETLARAVIAIESGGRGFADNRLIMRFEPHVFIAKLQALYWQHFTTGDPAWNGDQHRCDGQPFHGDQDAEYNAQAVALRLATDAALESASYGLGQIMGFNYAACGYASAEAMIAAFQSGEGAQMRAMFEFFRNRKDGAGKSALDHLRGGDLVAFATIYNGPGQAQHYAKLIRQMAGR